MTSTNQILLILFTVMFIGCNEPENKTTSSAENFVENTVDFVIEHKNNKAIELPFLYDSLVSQIPDDSNERSILAEVLKKKGFKVINWGRGNYPPRWTKNRVVGFTEGQLFLPGR